MIDKETLLAKIAVANQEILEAENDLERVIRDIQVSPRAEKIAITKVVEEAIAKVKATKTCLVELESLIGSSEA